MDLRSVLDRLQTHLTNNLPYTDFQQNEINERWNHSQNPIVIDGQADPLAHLGFLVALGDAVYTTGGRRNSITKIRARVEVSFTYRLRPTDQVADMRLSTVAAREIIRLVCDEAAWAPGEVNAIPQTRYSAQLVPDQPYLFVVTSFDLDFEEPV